jgi:hypothetical protein
MGLQLAGYVARVGDNKSIQKRKHGSSTLEGNDSKFLVSSVPKPLNPDVHQNNI